MNQSNPLKSSQITPKEIYQKRRSILMSSLSLAAGSIGLRHSQARAQTDEPKRLTARPNPAYVLLDKPTPYKSVTGYNNFYELGTGKSDPAEQAHRLKTRPWTVRVDGLVNRPKTFDIDDLIKLAPLEERVYRLRCVEGWSMVIPWIGYPLHHLLRQVQPQGSAKFVEFVTLADSNQMPGLARRVLDWPYREGLRLDEAQHSLTLLTFGLYGEVLPGQNGAPIRVVTPWKYGFKSPKSIVSIRLTDTMPQTSWNVVAPFAYGFYANVNPEVDHPRWSQATERRIGDEGGFFAPRRKTLMFNGYAEQVASLYSGMDLSRHF